MRLLVGGTVLIVLLWTSLLYHLRQVRESELDQARRDVTNLSIALAEQVSRVIHGTDQVMQLMQDDFRRNPDRFDFAAWATRVAALHGVANQLAMFDSAGNFLASQVKRTSQAPVINVADRAYFSYLASHPEAGLYVDRTYLGRLRNVRSFQLARRLSAPDGSFRGVIVSGVDPNYFAQKFDALDIGKNGSVALLGLDGYVRARMPETPAMYDRNISQDVNSGVFEQLKVAPEGTYQLTSAFDGHVRVFGYRQFESLPLVLVVGKSLDEILVPVEIERDRVLIAGALITLAVACFLFILDWESKRREIRERRLFATERALREAEAGFRGLFESSSDILCVHRIAADGTVSLDVFNKAAALARGLDPVTAAGRRLVDLLPPPVAATALQHIKRVVETGQPLRTQENRSFADGRYYETVLVPLFEDEANRRVTRVFVSIRDITHLREIEQAIVQSEARYRLLAETTSDIITSLNLDFERVYVSPACRAVLGYEPEEMLGRIRSDSIHPDDAARMRGLARQLIAGEADNDRQTYTYRTRHKLGHWVWLEASVTLGYDQTTGKPSALTCALRDVTKRRDAEAAIQASEMRFRLLAENTSETIMLVHANGRRSYVSPASQRLLGYSPAELGSERLSRILHPDCLEAVKAGMRQIVDGAVETTIVVRAQHRGGSWIWIEAVLRRILEARRGEPTVVVTLRDISERRAQSEALQTAKREAEHASQAKTDFLAAMSHEIRTPLNGILGYTDLLLNDGDFAGERRRYVERIHNAGAALRSVVDDILDFSKIEAGRADLEALPFSPSILADSAVSIVLGNVHAKALTIKVDIDPRVPATLLGDGDRLRQILLNLLNNAVKFTPAGAVVLSVRCLGVSEDAAQLRFAVQDTGIGIPEDQRARLFQRFSQVDGSIRRQYGGTGLGLAICKSLVDAMGGSIGVEHTVPQGSTFWFTLTLPLGDAAAVSGRDGTSIVPAAHPAIILLVEDHEVNQDLARTVLQAAGHIVDVVANGAEAVQAVQARSYDLVLMDVQMPVMDGLSATRHIRQLAPPACATPIIAMSANVLPAQIAGFRSAGMDDHVGKPFRQPDLLAAVQRWTSPALCDREVRRGAAGAIDQQTHRQLQDLVGATQVQSYMQRVFTLVDGLTSRIDAPGDRKVIAGEAHALIAATGMLGLRELATLMRQLEWACHDDEEQAPVDLDAFCTAIRSARQNAKTAMAQLGSAHS